MHGDKARAKTLHAGEILVAIGLVNGAFTTEFRIDRHHRDAVRLHAAIAATFAHRFVDDGAFRRIDHFAALAAAAFFRGARLIVDDAGQTGNFAEFALHLIVIVAMVNRHAGRPFQTRRIFFRLVGDDRNALRAFGVQLQGDLRHRQLAVDGLAAGHRHGIVV